MISIVIVNYNTSDLINKYLISLYQNLATLDFEVIIVDNHSKIFPFTAKENYKNLSVYYLNENKGFGAGCNYGVSKCTGKYILFLNPDVEILDSSLKKLVDFMDENEEAGACSGLTVDEENKISYCYNFFPDLKWNFKQATGIGLMKTIHQLTDAKPIHENKIFEVDWFHGAFLMVRKTVFNSIKGFDENIFLYYEDVDLQKRIKNIGFKIYCLPDVRVLHETQGSVKGEKGRKIYYFHMNMGNLYYMNKYYNFFEKFLVRFFYISGTLFKLLISPFRKKYRSNLTDYFKNHFIVLKVYLLKFNVKSTQNIS